jgi:hypothetical protein
MTKVVLQRPQADVVKRDAGRVSLPEFGSLAELSQWVDDNATNLAGVRAVLKRVLAALVVLQRD